MCGKVPGRAVLEGSLHGLLVHCFLGDPHFLTVSRILFLMSSPALGIDRSGSECPEPLHRGPCFGLPHLPQGARALQNLSQSCHYSEKFNKLW